MTITFLGARELLEEAGRQPTYALTLRLHEQAIAPKDGEYILLTSLSDYCSFITDDKQAVRHYIFDSNVRDYQGDVEVNADIRKTLESDNHDLDFWHLNNGITILASQATPAAKQLTLSDVQIVNGLQTSMEIYGYFRRRGFAALDNRRLLVRIIVTTNSDHIDRIIKAANFKTRILDASLRATETIQRDIERYFGQRDWYYDRRKNHYKNLGKPPERIVGIPYLAQAVMAIALKEPNNARARPSSLIKADSDYKRVFNPEWHFGVYLYCARVMKQLDALISQFESPELASWARNLRYHLALVTVSMVLKNGQYKPEALACSAESVAIDYGMLQRSARLVSEAAKQYRASHADVGDDRLAKSADFDLLLRELLES